MYKSVKNHEGFYIARYEAGVPNTTNSTTTEDANKKDQTGNVKPLSQKNVGVWNSIPWGGTGLDKASDNLPGNDKADGAVKVARSMYTKSDTCSVTATLCYGVQWDAALNFIDSTYESGDVNSSSVLKTSNGKGNYNGNGGITTTGSRQNYQLNHIYDMAGNVNEWTMEALFEDRRVYRGGSYLDESFNSPISFRGCTQPEDAYHNRGFRVALYL